MSESEDYPQFFRILKVRNTVELTGDAESARITQLLELDSERAATLFIAQLLDEIEMYEPARYQIEKGINRIPLKPLRVIHPRLTTESGENVFYSLGVNVLAAGFDPIPHRESRHLGS